MKPRRVNVITIGDAGRKIMERFMEKHRPDFNAVGLVDTKGQEESIRRFLSDTDIVIIIAGMGGKAGTEGVPVIAEIAKEMGVRTVALVTIPFKCEDPERLEDADRGINQLEKSADDLIAISLDKMIPDVFSAASLNDAYEIADRVLGDRLLEMIKLLRSTGIFYLKPEELKKQAKLERKKMRAQRICEAQVTLARLEYEERVEKALDKMDPHKLQEKLEDLSKIKE